MPLHTVYVHVYVSVCDVVLTLWKRCCLYPSLTFLPLYSIVLPICVVFVCFVLPTFLCFSLCSFFIAFARLTCVRVVIAAVGSWTFHLISFVKTLNLPHERINPLWRGYSQVCMCVHVCMYVCVHACVCMCACMCVCICVCLSLSLSLSVEPVVHLCMSFLSVVLQWWPWLCWCPLWS